MARAASDAPPRPSARWSSGLSAVFAALSVALAHAPENAAYGLLAFAPLGLAFGSSAMALALLGSVIVNVLASLLGGGRLVSGQRASLSLLTAGLVGTLTHMQLPAGPPTAAQVVALTALAVIASGLLQIGFGLLKLGSIVKYTPHPVRVGVTSGVGLLLLDTALPVITGHDFGSSLRTAFQSMQAGAIVVGLSTLVVTALAARLQRRVPPVLVGLLAASLLHFLLALALPSLSLGRLIGAPALMAHGLSLDPLAALGPGLLQQPVLILLGSYALTAAVLCSLDTLLAVSVIDGRLRRARDANRELWAQGLANCVAGVITALPLSPSLPRTLALVLPHPGRRQIVLCYALALLAILLLVPQLVGQIPISAIGGVLLLQGAQMVAPAFQGGLRALRQLGSQGGRSGTVADSPAGLQRSDWFVELAVALGALAFGLGPAVLIGASCAVLLFVRSNMRDVVRREWTGQSRRSLKARPSAPAEALAAEGGRIALLELEGALFFGTADGLRARLDELEESVDSAILDLHQVNEIDVTAARILCETAEHWGRIGKHLVFAEWAAGDARRQLIEGARSAPDKALDFCDHTDLALEQAEDRLLERLHLDGAVELSLGLADTMLGRGLDGAELALLAAELRTLEFQRGQLLFRVGDPGDGLYISLEGDIGLRIPGSARRLASFAPGVVIGEMAMLARGSRSAEAFAESEVTAMKLPLEAFDRLSIEHPALAAKLLKNMSLHLADRVRSLTGDLSRWVSRAAAGRGAGTSGNDRIVDSESMG